MGKAGRAADKDSKGVMVSTAAAAAAAFLMLNTRLDTAPLMYILSDNTYRLDKIISWQVLYLSLLVSA